MKQVRVVVLSALMVLLGSWLGYAQQSVATAGDAVVPPLVRFSGTLADVTGKPLTGIVGATFALYKDQQGGAPLWLETQNVTPDKNGHYSILLGSTSSTGLPADLFVAGEARWLAVQPQGQGEQARVLLLSVPYALKAADAQTLGGLPASAFVLAAPPSSSSAPATPDSVAPAASAVTPATSSDVSTTGGTVNAVPLFTTAANIQNSLLTQTGTSAINVSGKLNLFATGTATASAGKNSQPQDFVASVFKSSTSTAVPQTFQLQAEPAGNDTATASGTLNLLYGSGTSKPAETGVRIASNGRITFAPGQTFPGTGDGTITGVTAGTDLTGGGTSGKITLNLDTTKVPQLATANTFTANQRVTGNLQATGIVGAGTTSQTAQLEAVVPTDGLLAFRLRSGPNSVLDITPVTNSVTSRAQTQLNTINSRDLIFLPGTGRFGFGTTTPNAELESVVPSDGTLAFRLDSGPNSFLDITPVTNSVTGRAQTQLSTANNRDLILLPGTGNVGIGTTTPNAELESVVPSDGTLALRLDSGSNSFLDITPITNSITGRFQTQLSTANNRDLILLPGTGNVGIGTTAPDTLLSVNGGADKPGGGSWATFSDGRLKNLNGSYSSGLSQILRINPIRYRYKPDNAMGIRDTDEHIGVVAQEVQRVIPEAVTENSKGYLLVNNDPIMWSMLNAIKEQQRAFQHQQAVLRTQAAAIRDLKSELRVTRQTLQKVKAQLSAAQPALVAAK